VTLSTTEPTGWAGVAPLSGPHHELARASAAVRAGVASVLNGLPGIVIRLGQRPDGAAFLPRFRR
jgi:hypothetical protein